MRSFQHEFNSRPLPRILLFALLAAVLIALGACSSGRGGNVAYEPENFGAPDVESLAVSPVDARISPQDKLEIRVFQVQDLTGEFIVDSAGQISFPLIGSVTAAGKTTSELSQQLAARLGAKYLQSPKVQVSIKELSEQTVTVDGSVRQPGVFPVRGATSLMKAIALARGTAPDANTSRVVVFRTVNGQKMAGAFDLAAIRRAQANDPIVYGNDIIIVDGNRARSVFGDLLASIPLLAILRPF